MTKTSRQQKMVITSSHSETVKVEGTVTTDEPSAPLVRVVVMLRTYDANITTVAKKTNNAGQYRVNAPWGYKLFARNATRQRFTTEAYNDSLDGDVVSGTVSNAANQPVVNAVVPVIT